jgi:hypothetical protein
MQINTLPFPARNIERKNVVSKVGSFFWPKKLRHLHRPNERLTKCASGGHQKKRTREKRTTNAVQNTCTIIVMLPSPHSLFFSIERRLNCRYPSVVRQRNQSRLKQTFATPIQVESIRQDDADVNRLSAYT